MKKQVQVWCLSALAAGGAGLAGCAPQSRDVSIGAPGAAGPVAKSTDDYRKIRFAEAMRGLVIEDGLVRIDADAAPELVSSLNAGDAPEALARGDALMAENDQTGAVGEYRRAIIAAPDVAAGYAGLGDAMIGKKKDDMALAAYRTAAMLAPADVGVRMKLAETINRSGDLVGWAEELENILALDPANGEAHARLAVARYYLGQTEAAREEAALAEQWGGNVPPQLKVMLNN